MSPPRHSLALVALLVAGCAAKEAPAPSADLAARDQAPLFEPEDLSSLDLAYQPRLTLCEDVDGNCIEDIVEPPFPVSNDPGPHMSILEGLERSRDGTLVLAPGATVGTYRLLFFGGRDNINAIVDTEWHRLHWDSLLEPGTAVRARAASGLFDSARDSRLQPNRWTPWFSSSPIDLQQHLEPNLHPYQPQEGLDNGTMLVEIELRSDLADQSPTLKRVAAAFKCRGSGGG